MASKSATPIKTILRSDKIKNYYAYVIEKYAFVDLTQDVIDAINQDLIVLHHIDDMRDKKSNVDNAIRFLYNLINKKDTPTTH